MKGITFIGPLIEATRDGNKTKTRRLMNPQPLKGYVFDGFNVHGDALFSDEVEEVVEVFKCPYKIGEKRYIQERCEITKCFYDNRDGRNFVKGIYKLDSKPFKVELTEHEWQLFRQRKCPHRAQSGRFMYKSLARYIIEITDIRAERLQDISARDAQAEGIELYHKNGNVYLPISLAPAAYTMAFQDLWDSINKERGHGWDLNEWVWVITYKLISKEGETL